MSPRTQRAVGIVLAIIVALAVFAGTAVFAEGPRRDDPKTLDYQLVARELARGVHVVAGANADFTPANGSNIINTSFVVTGDGVLVVNTGLSKRYGEQLRALIARTTPLGRRRAPDHLVRKRRAVRRRRVRLGRRVPPWGGDVIKKVDFLEHGGSVWVFKLLGGGGVTAGAAVSQPAAAKAK